MNRTRRARLFLLAAGVVFAAVLLLARTPPDRADRRPADPARAPQSLAPKPSGPAEKLPLGTEPPDPPGAQAQRHAARKIAVRFLHAFLDLQQTGGSRGVRRRLGETATGGLRRLLLDRPARGDPPAPPSVERLALYGPFDGALKASVALDYPRGGRGLLELELRPRAGRWRVTRIYP